MTEYTSQPHFTPVVLIQENQSNLLHIGFNYKIINLTYVLFNQLLLARAERSKPQSRQLVRICCFGVRCPNVALPTTTIKATLKIVSLST